MLITNPLNSSIGKTFAISTERTKLKIALYNKQKLYAQMLKDNITGPVKDQLQEEIAEINTKLYNQLKK